MGYTTEFQGSFTLNKPLDDETYNFLIKFNETRRMARKVDPKYGVEGEFYVDGKGFMGQDNDETVIDQNRSPSTQPSLWCQWRPSEDHKTIEWDGNEKFYYYVEWIQYICEKILAPKGYKINGQVKWRGEDFYDTGVILAIDNLILTPSEETYFHLKQVSNNKIESFLKVKENLPPLVGLDPHLDAWIANELKE